jgi:hypothetical protein
MIKINNGDDKKLKYSKITNEEDDKNDDQNDIWKNGK